MYTLENLTDEMKIYFNWSANALMPFYSKAADLWLTKHRDVIIKVAHELIATIQYEPCELYRGIILREPVQDCINHLEHYTYLSFSEDKSIARHFANVNGFGSEYLDVSKQLGNYGYVITYTPEVKEILFHHNLLRILPYAQAFTMLGMNGIKEVKVLAAQKEVMILQPDQPFNNIEKYEKYIAGFDPYTVTAPLQLFKVTDAETRIQIPPGTE